jgi:hypothetical protein
MFELIGLIFGGVSRLAQHWMELRDKDKERSHEAVMYDKQIELADRKHVHDAELRRMDGEQADAAAEWDAMRAAVEAQAREAAAAGGWVAQFSASIRPFLTVWHLVVLYTAVKAAMLMVAMQSGQGAFAALLQVYGPEDKALAFSMAGFWFQDRALRRTGRT